MITGRARVEPEMRARCDGTYIYITIKANPFGQSQNAAVTANGPAALYARGVCPLQFIIIFAHHLQQSIRPDDDDEENLFKPYIYILYTYI